MKKIGVIGGAGPLASALLYETLINESYAHAFEMPEIVLINFPFTRGLSCDEGKRNEDAIHSELSYCVDFLVKNRVEVGVLACNTLHLYLPQHLPRSIRFYSLPQLVLKAACNQKHMRLLILGTENTRRSNLYHQEGIVAHYPSIQDQAIIGEVIDQVLKGVISQRDAISLGEVIDRSLKEQDFDGVVLGCTDLPVLHHHFPIPSPKKIYDSIKIPAKTIVGAI